MDRPEPIEQDKHQAGDSGHDSDSSEEPPLTASEDEETSSSGSSSEDDDEEGVEGDGALAVPPPSRLPQPANSPTTLKSRLVSFIPQLQQANADLETDPDAATKRLDDVADDEEQYIEMNLGLGVLKGKHAAGKQDAVKTYLSDDSESSSDESTSTPEEEAGAGTTEVGIVDKLKGVKSSKRKIEEVN